VKLQLSMKTVLFVCSGNTCRSPLALAAWRALEREQPLPGWEAQSAGTLALQGASASGHAQSVAQSWNQDLSTHSAQLLDENCVRDADLIVTMTQSQAEIVRAQFPASPAKVEVLGRYATAQNADDTAAKLERLLESVHLPPGETQNCDILDPFGGSLEEYQHCAAQIRQAVEALRESLRKS
jgi:protein-tyrosine-phosphatase